ncbi:cytochrome P450 [Streptomyces sp. LUP47B]|uniref:cytochrome P450 n=1 Tax=Streptomyces sp. LUP47B TaxID=1890286 RepID=UPI0008516A25|nr:cytochrome P450 [Streptomyces sp. LUP47B]
MTMTSPSPVPSADWVDPVVMSADPYPTYRRLLDESPVAWVPSLNLYLVTSSRACRAIEEDQQTYSAKLTGDGGTMARAVGARPMLSKDDPDHATERRVINPTLRPKNLRARWAPVFEHNARTHLVALREQGPDQAELNRDYAAPVASQNLIDLLGFKDVDIEDMRRWSNAFVAGIGNLFDDPEIWRRNDAAREEVDALLDELIPYYRSHPDDTIVSAFANAELPLTQVIADINLIISGGMNEPQHAITSSVWALSRHPGQRERALADPALWPAVFDETVRWLSPIGMYRRVTTREVVLRDVTLPAHAPIGVVVGAANRDPAEFDGADEFDITRPRQPHLAFGSGVHLCAGHWAARIGIGEIAIPLLYTELPGLRTDPRRQEAWHGWFFRGLTTLPVTWN